MIKTYKILSLLLSYPTPDLQEFLGEALAELQDEALLAPEEIRGVGEFASYFRDKELIDWEAEYVQLFDHTRSACLYLFEHVMGDSRDRGQAMVDMVEFYRENGWQLSPGELPDYIPVFLEFLSGQEPSKAAGLLAEPVHIINRICLALQEKNNPYRHILSAVVSLSAKPPGQKETDLIIKNEKKLDLDAEYEECHTNPTGHGKLP